MTTPGYIERGADGRYRLRGAELRPGDRVALATGGIWVQAHFVYDAEEREGKFRLANGRMVRELVGLRARWLT